MEDIKIDMGKAIETSIWMNSEGKHNLRRPTLIFELCKRVRVQFIAQEEKN